MRDWYKDWEDRSGQNDYDEEDGKFSSSNHTTAQPQSEDESRGAGVDYEPVPPPDSGEYEESFILPYGMSEEDLEKPKAEAQLKVNETCRAAQPKKVGYKQLSIFELLKKNEGEAE